MTRDVNLLAYLPPFMQDFTEIAVTLNAEDPEFVIVWDSADRVLKNQFIETADEYGISRFEKILKILPSKEDTLESRRSRVQNRWFNDMPYTMRTLIQRLTTLCADHGFTLTKYFTDAYTLEIHTDLELFGQVEELERVIQAMIPCNLVVISQNDIPCAAAGSALAASGVVAVENYFITQDFNETDVVQGGAIQKGGMVFTGEYFITEDFTENNIVSGAALQGGGISNTVKVVITQDFNETMTANGSGTAASGVSFTESVEIKSNEN